MNTLAPRVRSARRRASALYCAVHGSGTPVLLLHGLGTTGEIFAPIIPALARSFQVIVPDLRGHGHSSCLPGPDSIERLADDLNTLLDLLHIDSCIVLGYASGGAVAQQLARAYPARVRALALVCAYARGAATLREQINARLRPELYRLLGPRRASTFAEGSTPRAVHATLDANRGGRVAPVARALLAFDSRAWLPQLSCPALIVNGGRDATTPAHHARELQALLPHAELRTLPRAGHWLVATHTDELLGIVQPWLAAHEVRA